MKIFHLLKSRQLFINGLKIKTRNFPAHNCFCPVMSDTSFQNYRALSVAFSHACESWDLLVPGGRQQRCATAALRGRREWQPAWLLDLVCYEAFNPQIQKPLHIIFIYFYIYIFEYTECLERCYRHICSP